MHCHCQGESALGRRFRGLLPVLFALALLTGCAPASRVATRPLPPHGSVGSILATARSQIGTPYHAAGTSPATGFDCSGFVQWVFAKNGIRLPRTTTAQSRTGHAVPWGKLKAGDLVFFTPSFRSSSLHVGIFDGAGSFIHSPSPGGRVRSESIMAPYWRTAYYKACRILP